MNALRVILPLALGLVAGILNFMVLHGSTAPLELATVKTNLPVDAELTEDVLDRVQVRAESSIFKSAVPYSKRGLLLGRRVKRPLDAGEVLLYPDVENIDETDIRPYLKPGETTLTIPVASSRIAPGLHRGDSIGVLVTRPAAPSFTKASPGTPTARILGPFRLIRMGPVSNAQRRRGEESTRQVIVAVLPDKDGKLDAAAAAVQEAINAVMTSDQNGGTLAVELYLAGPKEPAGKPLGTQTVHP